MTNYRFVSSLSCETIAEIVSKQKTSWFSGGYVSGKAYGRDIEIRSNPGFQNSWNPIFYGSMGETPEGTVITGCFRPHPSVKIFMLLFRGLLAFSFVIALLYQIFLSTYIKEMLVCLGGIGFTFAVEKLGEHLGNADKPTVLRFIEKELCAKQHEASLSP